MSQFLAGVWAPIWWVYNWNAPPWFKATDRHGANKANAVGIMAALVCITLVDLWLLLSGQDGSALPDQRFVILPAIVIFLVFHLYFNRERFDRLLTGFREMEPNKRRLAVTVGLALYGLMLVDLFTQRAV